MFDYASKIIAVANDMKTQLVNLGANAFKVVVSPCAPNASFFDVNPTYSNNIFLVVGRFVDKKAPYYTIEAFRHLVTKKPEAKMVMIGDGYLLNTCKNLVKTWNLEDSVIFTGSLAHDNIIDYFNKSFCFLQHSITADDGDSEGSPVSVMEASAAGLPVIATKHMGIKESVKHGQTGFLVEEGDVIGMHNYMLQLFNNRELAADLGLNGRAYIQANFSMESHISMIQSAIDASFSQ
jgi:glycosyltransferase involved in cell wall biosynthesis